MLETLLSFLFILVPTGILSLLYTYIGWRLIAPLPLSQGWKRIAWTGVILLATFPIAGVVIRLLRIEALTNDIVYWLAYPSLGFASILFFFVLLKDLLLLIGRTWRKLGQWLNPQEKNTPQTIRQEEVTDGRRQFLWTATNLGIFGMTGLLTGCGMVQVHQQIQTQRVKVPLKGLPEAFEGFRIVQISDLHVGPTIKAPFVEEVVATVNDLNPDIIVLTGDLVDGSVGYLAADVQPLSQLKARQGKYFVTGNHEYYSGVLSWLKKFEALGIDPLLNEHRQLTKHSSNLIIGGVTDIKAGQMISAHKSSPSISLDKAPEFGPKILLAHQPISVYEASKAGYDLQISGHTHGGQYFPYSSLIGLVQPFVAGLYKHDKTWLYVNRGTGYWGPPMRLGSPAEITEITLTNKAIIA